jgi:DNA repair exonuclease SbcCD ATPase subunit
VSNKQPQLLNNWLKIGSVAFGVSCGCTLPFTQNLAQSALIGLATMPGVAASVVVRSRQRQRQIDRQLERGKVRLRELEQRGESLTEQLQLRGQDYRTIELRVAQLHSLAASLNDRIDRDRQQQAQLEQKLATITLYCEEQQAFATKLDRKIQDKQALSLEVDTNFNSLKLELSQLQSEQVRLENSNHRANIVLGNIQAEIDRSSVIKRELERQICELQTRQQVAVSNVVDSIDRQRLVLQELELAIVDQQKVHTETIAEVEQLEQLITARSPELISQEQRLAEIQTRSIELDLELKDKRLQLMQIESEILSKNSSIESSSRELELVQLELRNSIAAETAAAQLERIDRQADLDRLESKLQAKLQEIDRIEATRLQSSDQQLKLTELDAEISTINNAIEQCHRELEIARLELRDRQAEIDNLESTIQNKLQLIDEIELDLEKAFQIFEPQPPIISRSIVLNLVEGEWHDKFVDNPHLSVLQHIEKHGTITESEASSKLGNARSVRQFANKLEEYAQDLPFSIRVESSPKGNRYLKEDRNQ